MKISPNQNEKGSRSPRAAQPGEPPSPDTSAQFLAEPVDKPGKKCRALEGTYLRDHTIQLEPARIS